MQEFVDRLPQASHYCTDRAAVYEEMMWPEGSTHVISHKKEQTHNIESLNADLRTYLGRLKRRSRCFSRSWEALARAIRPTSQRLDTATPLVDIPSYLPQDCRYCCAAEPR